MNMGVEKWMRLNALPRVGIETLTKRTGGLSARFYLSNEREWRQLNDNYENERPVLEFLMDDVSPESVFYDVGANVGLYSCFIGQCCDAVAFEPHPGNYARLTENLRLNGVDADARQMAVGADSSVSLFPTGDGPGDGRAKVWGGAGGSDTVQSRSIDSLVREGASRPTHVKIDVEGHEDIVVSHMTEVMAACDRLTVVCEVHTKLGVSPGAIVETMDAHGFDAKRIQKGAETVYLFQK